MRILLGILGGLLLLLLLLLWIPLRFDFATDGEETTLRLRWLFLKLQLLPPPEEPPAAQPDVPEKEKPERPEKGKKQKKDPLELVHTGFLLLQSSWGPLRRMLKSIVVEKLILHWAVTGEDAAQTALAVGRYNALVGGAYGTASLLLTMRPADLAIVPDFLGEEDRLDLRFIVRVRPGMAAAMGLSALGIFLGRYLKERIQDPGSRRERSAAAAEPQGPPPAEPTIHDKDLERDGVTI